MSKILQNRTKYKLYILVLNNDRLDFYKTTYNITKLQLEFRTHRKSLSVMLRGFFVCVYS